LSQAQASEVPFLDAFPQSIAKIVLQNSELHKLEYSTEYSNLLFETDFHSRLGITTLTAKIMSYTLLSVYNSL
jgi:hypothetical protein